MSVNSVDEARNLWVVGVCAKPIVLCSSGWGAKHDGIIPSVDEIVKVFDIPPKDDCNYERKKELLLWYVDDLIPYCVGNDQWGKNTRRYNMMVSPVLINGKAKPIVTAKGEAMCWTIYSNCYKKWVHICREIRADPTWKIPKFKRNNESTHQYYDTRWSDNCSGKVTRGGWKPEAFTVFNAYTKDISAFRLEDHRAGWKKYRFAKNLLRKEHNVTATKYTGKRKRKSSPEATPRKFSAMMLVKLRKKIAWIHQTNTYCCHQPLCTRTLWR